jgi:RNA polymerase sigma-70 factor (ECF subfamily)
MSATYRLVALAPAIAQGNMGTAAEPRSNGRSRWAGKATGGQRLTTTAIAEESDEALAGLIATGDRRAFGEIVRRHGGRLRSLALRFSGGAGEADDIVQETFLSFWRTAGRWQPGGPPLGAYLTRIAVNRAIDGDRRRRVRRFFGIEAAVEVADPQPATDAKLESKRALAAVAKDIAALPARQRAAILLAADGDRSNMEIGAAMGLSEGAVEQLLVRARRTLRMRLAERDG